MDIWGIDYGGTNIRVGKFNSDSGKWIKKPKIVITSLGENIGLLGSI